MSAATNYLEDKVLNHMLNAIGWTAPTSVLIGLSTTPPTEAGGNVSEPGDTYARVTVTGSPPFTLQNQDPREAVNTNPVEFAEATGSWGTITHFLVYDQLGNLLAFNALTASITVAATETVRFKAGELKVTVD